MLSIIDIDQYFKDFMNTKQLRFKTQTLLVTGYINKLPEDEKRSFINHIVELAMDMEDSYQIVKMVETLFEIAKDKREYVVHAYDSCIHNYISYDYSKCILLSKLNDFSTIKEMDDVVANAVRLFTPHTRPYYRALLITIISQINQEDRDTFVSDVIRNSSDITDDADGSMARIKEAQKILINYRETRIITPPPMPLRLRM